MTPRERLELAHRSAEPDRALRSLVKELSAEGNSKGDIYALLEAQLLELRARAGHVESEEEPLLGAMDALSGWCHPDARLLSDEPFAG